MILLGLWITTYLAQSEIQMAGSDRAAYIRDIIGSGTTSATEIARRMAATFLTREYISSGVSPDKVVLVGETEKYYTLAHRTSIGGPNEREFVVRVAKDGAEIECVSGTS